MDENELIKDWSITLQRSADQQGGEQPNSGQRLEGLYCIDQEKLNSLSASKLAELRDNGGLLMAICQLLSMRNLSGLAEVANLVSTETESSEILFDDGLDTGTISFDRL